MRIKIEKLWDFVSASFSIRSGNYDAVIIPIIKTNGKEMLCCRIKYRTRKIGDLIQEIDPEWFIESAEVVCYNKTAEAACSIIEKLSVVEVLKDSIFADEKAKTDPTTIFLVELSMSTTYSKSKNVVTEIICGTKSTLLTIGRIPDLKDYFRYACGYAIVDLPVDKVKQILEEVLNNTEVEQ